MNLDDQLYDEFGNYIGPAMEEEEPEPTYMRSPASPEPRSPTEADSMQISIPQPARTLFG
jgi:hypothetical protein